MKPAAQRQRWPRSFRASWQRPLFSQAESVRHTSHWRTSRRSTASDCRLYSTPETERRATQPDRAQHGQGDCTARRRLRDAPRSLTGRGMVRGTVGESRALPSMGQVRLRQFLGKLLAVYAQENARLFLVWPTVVQRKKLPNVCNRIGEKSGCVCERF